jgi:hypothetical protein
MKLKSVLGLKCLSLVNARASIQSFLLFIGLLSAFGWGGALSFASAAPLSLEMEQQIIARRLWESRHWEKILFVPDRLYPSKRSVVDDPRFFLSSGGKTDPKEELLATWRSFFLPQDSASLDTHSQCMFPARKRWILRQLQLDPKALPQVSCPRFETYLGLASYQGASLVFSNYYLGNPASMFGHTFITFHTNRKDAGPDSGKSNMFADVLNFSAFVDDTSAFLYPLKGLMGFFPGRFAMMPFYRKIQEYNNGESRDLWEYELKLTPSELEDAPYMIWELGAFSINYFYIDENCSQLLLSFLEALRPSLQISGDLAVYSIPADTIRVVVDEPGLTGKITHKASSLSRYVYRLGILDEKERQYLSRLIGDEKEIDPSFYLLNKDSQAKVLDTAAEWIDFTEKVVGSQSVQKFGAKRFQILGARASTGVIDPPVEIPVQSTAPHLGHDSGGLGLALLGSLDSSKSLGSESRGPSFELSLRPALHETRSPGLGYSDELEILFLDFLFRKEADKQIVIEKFKFFSILALPRKIPFIDQNPWGGQLGFERNFSFQSRPESGKLYVKGGKGIPVSFSSLDIFGYILFSPEVLWSEKERIMAGPTSSIGLFYSPSSTSKLSLTAEWAKYFNKEIVRSSARTNLTYAIKHGRDIEIKAEIDKQNARKEAKINLIKYF